MCIQKYRDLDFTQACSCGVYEGEAWPTDSRPIISSDQLKRTNERGWHRRSWPVRGFSALTNPLGSVEAGKAASYTSACVCVVCVRVLLSWILVVHSSWLIHVSCHLLTFRTVFLHEDGIK